MLELTVGCAELAGAQVVQHRADLAGALLDLHAADDGTNQPASVGDRHRIPNRVEVAERLADPSRFGLHVIQTAERALDLGQPGLSHGDGLPDLLHPFLDQAPGSLIDPAHRVEELLRFGRQRSDLRREIPPLVEQLVPRCRDVGVDPFDHVMCERAVGRRLADPFDHVALDRARGKRPGLASALAMLVLRDAPVIPIGLTARLRGGRGRHGQAAVGAAKQAAKEVLGIVPPAALVDGPLERGRHPAERRTVDDRRVLSVVGLVAVRHQPGVDRVLEDAKDGILAPLVSGAKPALLRRVLLGLPVRLVQAPRDGERGAAIQVEREDVAHQLGLALDDHKLLVLDTVAERHRTARPLAAPASGGDLVAGALGDHLAFKLGEAHQHVQREAADGVRGGEVLGDADERGVDA